MASHSWINIICSLFIGLSAQNTHLQHTLDASAHVPHCTHYVAKTIMKQLYILDLEHHII